MIRNIIFALLILITLPTCSFAAVTKAEVRNDTSGPALYINGVRTAPTMLFVSSSRLQADLDANMRGEAADAGKHGINLLTFDISIQWPKAGEAPDFTIQDLFIDKLLAANPNALLIPRIRVTWEPGGFWDDYPQYRQMPPAWWGKEHPDDIVQYQDGTTGTGSVHSLVFRKTAVENMKQLVTHIEKKYGEHVVGYHPTGQHSNEWFFEMFGEDRLSGFEKCAMYGFRDFLKAKYKTEKALKLAWGNPDITFEKVQVPSYTDRSSTGGSAFVDPLKHRREIDFYEYENNDMADTAEAMCKAAKEIAPNKLAVLFYGYHYELAVGQTGLQSSGHLSLSRLLKSKYVDIIAAPVSYRERAPGDPGYFMAPIDTVQLNGKLWLTEDDSRTHLSPPDSGYGRSKDARETYGVLYRNFAHQLTRGGAIWWMDLISQGWFAGDDMWNHLSQLRDIYQTSMQGFEKYHPEIAVIADERSCFYESTFRVPSKVMVNESRDYLYRIGAPLGMYLLDDLVAGKVPLAKMYIFLDVFRLDKKQIAAIRKYACKRGSTVVWTYAPGIIRDNRMSADYIPEITGINLREGTARPSSIVLSDGTTFTPEPAIVSPTFIPDDAKAQVLAHYSGGSDPAIVSRKMKDWTSVYSGCLTLPPKMLRDLAIEAGVNIYSDQGETVMAGNGFVGLHAASDGIKTIKFPGKSKVSDCISGENLGTMSALTVGMKKGDTKILRVTPVH